MLPSEAATTFSLCDKEGRQWSADVAPYMVEPLDLLASRRYNAIVFVGPARTSKTFSLLLGGINWISTCAPGDTLVVQMSQDTARDFSKFEFDPAARHSTGLRDRLSPRRSDANTFDKKFRSGMVLKFGWPAVSQVSGKTMQYVFLTDYDRPENRDNVDGEGTLFDLGYKRITTYMSRGKCLVESSPGEDQVDAAWTPETPHQAPPCNGILSLYNRGTMARLYWACLDCGERMQVVPGPGMFALPEFDELVELVSRNDPMELAREYARVVCPHCGSQHLMQHRPDLNKNGVWLHEGERFENGVIVGDRRETKIASYWMGGAAAAYQRWDAMLQGYFEAVREYRRTGDENPIRTKTNTDFGAPYMPRAAAKRRRAEDLMRRAEHETWPKRTVPKGVQFLIGVVDIQANRFVVAVYGFGEGLETWLVDRFEITQSLRLDGDRALPVDPAAYDTDWHLLIDEVIKRSYPLEEDESLRMPIYYSHCDSGGAAGVTYRAYEFWRHLKTVGLHNRFRLVKGASQVNAARIAETWPDAKNKIDRVHGARGDVPVYLLNTTIWKDAIVGDMARDLPGPGYLHLASWTDRDIFAEYVAETREADGWKKKAGKRNEQFDLHVYARAACAAINAERINWARPPSWAIRPESAGQVVQVVQRNETRAERMERLAQQLNG
jgi:phage terminase large subunit GpA-like protein